MNIQEENKIRFDIDQNKQKINYLMKKNKEGEDNLTEMSQKISSAETELSNLNTEVSKLQDSSSTEEKIEFLSYDVIKVVDNTYRDSLWEPLLIYFAARPNSRVKMHISFTQKNTFPASQPRTATTSIILDDQEIYTKETTYENGPEETPIEFTHIFTSNTGGHKLKVKISNTCPDSTFTTYIKPDYFVVELFGTNVQFITRTHDFMVAAGPNKNLMTTTCIDEKPRFSAQTADENLSLDTSMFRTGVFNNYRKYNFLTPFFDYRISSDGTVTRYENPGIMWSNYSNYSTTRRVSLRFQVTDSETEYMVHDNTILSDGAYDITIQNSVTIDAPYILAIENDKNLCYNHKYSTIYIIKDSNEIFADCAGLHRLDNFELNKDIIGFVTRTNGKSFMTHYVQGDTNPPRLELGVGTHINAYLRADNSIEVYMRVGKDCKKLIIKKDPNAQKYFVESSQIIENVQEYWLGADGTHFERVGNNINYYPQNATAPTQTFEVFY